MRFHGFAGIAAVALLSGSPAAASIAAAEVARTAPATLSVTWTDANPVDVYVAEAADATVRTAKLVSKADADGRFDYADPTPARDYFILRDAKTGEVVKTAERLLPLEQGSNFRDIGGYPAAGGKHVRWGLIYRSGATPLLTDADIARVQALGLHDIIDLRSSEERQLAPTRLTGIRYTAIDYSMMAMMKTQPGGMPQNGGTMYRNFPTFFAPQLRIVFEDLIRKQGPLVYHCSAGQDRTGFTTGVILSALGVPRDVILSDYHLSTSYRRPEYELPKISPEMARINPVASMFAGFQSNPAMAKPQPLKDPDGKAFLSSAFDEIEARWGSIDTYLEKEVGVTKADLALLRATYLE